MKSEFVSRLEQVCLRLIDRKFFRKPGENIHRWVLDAKFVGHMIYEDGFKFSRGKITRCFKYLQPSTVNN